MPKDNVAILTGDFGAQHANEPSQILKTLNYGVDVVSPDKQAGEVIETVFHYLEGDEQTYREKSGRGIICTRDFKEVSANDYAGLIIPGCRAPEYLGTREEALSLVREMNEADKPVAGMCHGPILLAAADILDGVRCNGSWLTRPFLEAAGAEWVEPTESDDEALRKVATHVSGLVVDGNIITAPVRGDFPQMMREFIKQMESQDTVTVDLDR